MKKNQSTPCIYQPIHRHVSQTTSFKIRKSNSIQKYRSQQYQTHLKQTLPHISLCLTGQKNKQFKPENSLKFIRSRLNRCHVTNKILIFDQKLVSQIKKNFKINPVQKIIHQNQNKNIEMKKFSSSQIKTKIQKIGNATISKIQKYQLTQRLYAQLSTQQLKGWSQKQSIDLQNIYQKGNIAVSIQTVSY